MLSKDSLDYPMDDEPLSEKINSIVDDVLGERAREVDKEEFFESLFLIARKHTRELQNLIDSRIYTNQDTPMPNSLPNSCSPFINIYVVDDSMNAYYPQNYSYNQMLSYNPSNIYSNGYQQPMFQQTIAQPFQQPLPQQLPQSLPQPFQQPNFAFGPQLLPFLDEISNKSDKKHKKKSDKKSKKDKHKSKSKDKKKDKKKEEKEEEDKKIMNFEYNGHENFNGIMKYLYNQTHSNIHDNGTIEITSNSSDNSTSSGPRNLADFGKEQSFRSNKTDLTTLCFDFKERSIQPTAYTIKSCAAHISTKGPFLRNWVIEVSNDNKEWTEIDQHSDDTSLKKSLTIVTFNVKEKVKKFYRYIRLRQTGNSWELNGTGKRIIIRGMEFFGKMKMP